MGVEINVMVGGEAGQGVQSAGLVIARALSRWGLSVFADQDYESRVRGGHNFFRVRAGDGNVGAVSETLDLLVALDQQTIDLHRAEVSGEGAIIFDRDRAEDPGAGARRVGLPLEQMALESSGGKLAANMVAVGAAMALAGYEREALRTVVLDFFGGEAGQASAAAAARGFEQARAAAAGGPENRIGAAGPRRRMLLNGNEAIALGALAAGCHFVSAYPMTPATSIMEYMAGKAGELGVAVVQPEDEIAAVNMIIGAAAAGVRAMTVTSGGGFCLMAEGLGLAGMTETPIVVVDGQRAGPAIGLPTRTEQADLLFALHASHGEFPRVVLAPGSVEDAFWLTVKAFNLAERHQVPVVILTDQYLASSYATAERFDLARVRIDRGDILDGPDPPGAEGYRRYRMTPSGVSPRAFPGLSYALAVADSDEHDQEGHMIEDAATRTAMMLKRLRKLDGLKQEISGPATHGPPGAGIALLGWGSTLGPLKEVVELAARDGLSVNVVHFSHMCPFPAEAAARALQGAEKTFTVENNATGQLARLLRAETGHQVSGSILRFDGRPFSPAGILEELRKEVS